MVGGLVVVLAACPVQCKLDTLALKLSGVTTGVRGGTTQYSIGSPSR